jgi:hypothetical protein
MATFNRRYLNYYLTTHSCVDCGEADPKLLEFDHKSSSNKSGTVSGFARKSFTELISEINKCDVRCVECHRIKTARDFGYYNDLTLEYV